MATGWLRGGGHRIYLPNEDGKFETTNKKGQEAFVSSAPSLQARKGMRFHMTRCGLHSMRAARARPTPDAHG